MRRAWLLLLIGCGKVATYVDSGPIADDDSGARPDAARVDAPSGPDATQVACTYVASTATSPLLTFTLAAGSFQSYGCADVDPTYWVAGAAGTMRIDFTDAQDRPSIRVWGMNDDDLASVAVNGAAYPLDATSAAIAPKVLCGVSPGPDGVVFSNGDLTGANSNASGNYSYNDVTLETTGVHSIEVDSLAGAGWGFAGASVGCN